MDTKIKKMAGSLVISRNGKKVNEFIFSGNEAITEFCRVLRNKAFPTEQIKRIRINKIAYSNHCYKCLVVYDDIGGLTKYSYNFNNMDI